MDIAQPTTTVTLPDGRVLACDDVGDPDGRVVVWLHGAPDCRLARHPDDRLAGRVGVRLVAVDRPGYGWSDPPAPDLLTFGDDIGVLLDDLGIERAAVAAWSAGVPWAIGAGAALGDRVTGIVTYGAIAPMEAMVADDEVAAAGPDRTEIARAVAAGHATTDDVADELAMLLLPTPPVPLQQAVDQVLESYSPSARAALEAIPGMIDVLARSLIGAVDRQGDAGLRADVAVQFRPGLEPLLAKVTCPVVLVHGERDPIAGPAVGQWFAERLADASVDVWAGLGHQGVLVDWERFLSVAR